MTGFRVLGDCEAFLEGGGREAVVDEGWDDDVESWLVVTALDEFGKHFEAFEEAAWPAMGEEKWNGVLHRAWLMDEVDAVSIEPIDGYISSILWERVQTSFFLPPVVLILPMLGKTFEFSERYATHPWLFVDDLVRESLLQLAAA